MTTIVCVLVRGHVKYTSEYVNRLASMVARGMDRPYRFVCLVDKPRPLHKSIEQIRIPWAAPAVYGWWAKLHVFRGDLGLEGRVLYLDLDTLIVDALGPLLDFPAPFALLPHAGRFEGLHGRTVVKRFNSSVMVFDAGAPSPLFDDWTPAVAARLWGDQDWIGEQAPDAATFPADWCPRFSSLDPKAGIPDAAKVVLMKTPKNVEAARRYRWVKEAWI